MSQSPSLCRSGCGFYGSPKTDGLCSKCYKDALKRKQANPAPPQISGRSSPTASAAVSRPYITIDEQLFPSKVRCHLVQYMPSKPDKFDIKFWFTVDVDKNNKVNT
ncbi:hypothetical protein TNCV_3954341 [Trichonephila clavipes]|nr:hypothetical protein TNCV_3954341 [Trichonephila clavipes]